MIPSLRKLFDENNWLDYDEYGQCKHTNGLPANMLAHLLPDRLYGDMDEWACLVIMPREVGIYIIRKPVEENRWQLSSAKMVYSSESGLVGIISMLTEPQATVWGVSL